MKMGVIKDFFLRQVVAIKKDFLFFLRGASIIALLLLSFYLGSAVLILWNPDRLVFSRPDTAYSEPPELSGIQGVELTPRRHRGEYTKAVAWYFQAEDSPYCILFFGSGQNSLPGKTDRLRWMTHHFNASLCAPDYPGFGKTPGETTEENVMQLASIWYDELILANGFSGKNILVWGRDIGSVVAASISKSSKPGLVLLESPFTKVADLAKLHYPYLPTEIALGDAYSTLDLLQSAKSNILLVAGTDNKVIPFSLSENLYRRLDRENISLIEVKGDHGSLVYNNKLAVLDRINSFLPGIVKGGGVFTQP